MIKNYCFYIIYIVPMELHKIIYYISKIASSYRCIGWRLVYVLIGCSLTSPHVNSWGKKAINSHINRKKVDIPTLVKEKENIIYG